MGEDDGRVLIGQFADATSRDPNKENQKLALALMSQNSGGAAAAQAHIMFDEVIVPQFEEGTTFHKLLLGMSQVHWGGLYASNSHKENNLLDKYLVKKVVMVGGNPNPKGSILERLTGKINTNSQGQS